MSNYIAKDTILLTSSRKIINYNNVGLKSRHRQNNAKCSPMKQLSAEKSLHKNHWWAKSNGPYK